MGEPTTPEEVRRTYFVLTGLYTLAAALIWGVNTLFLLDAGLTLAEVFLANAFFTGGMVVFEIPTGVVADTLGRRVSFLLSVGVLAATTAGYVGLAQIDAGLPAYAGVSVLMGLGFTFYSGAMEAWLVDALTATGFDGDLADVFARGQMVGGAAMLVGTLSGGVLGSIDLAAPFVVRTVLLVVVFGTAAGLMHDQGFQPRPLVPGHVAAEVRALARSSVTLGWSEASLRLLMLAGLVQGGVMTWVWYAWQPYFLELLGRDAVWVAGVVSALVSLSMMGGNRLVELLGPRVQRRTTLLLWAAAATTLGCAVVGLANSFPVALVGLLVITTSLGLRSPVRQAYFHAMVPTQQRATVLSFDSLVANAGGTGGQVTLGHYSERAGVAAGYVASSGVLALALPLVLAVRRRRDAADWPRHHRHGTTCTCPAPGLPDLAGLETTVPATPAVT